MAKSHVPLGRTERLTSDVGTDNLRLDASVSGPQIRPSCIVREVDAVKNSIKLFAVLLGVLLLASSCASLSYPVGDTAERINWREYNDC